MSQPHHPRPLWRSVAFAVGLCALAFSTTSAKDSDPVKSAEQHLQEEDPKAALIGLKNGIRKSPQDPAIRVKIARLYFQLGDVASAEREARIARDLKGDEADYLPVLIDTLLVRKKFKDLFDSIEPGDRTPVLESRVRTALGTAAVGLHYDVKAEALLRDAIRLDPSAKEAPVQLAWFLNRTHPEDADRVIDNATAANPQSAELARVKGEMLWSRGDANAAVRLFDDALKIDPDYQLARLSRANVNIARTEFAAADTDLNSILQAAPDNLIANYLRGLEQVKKGEYAAADRTLDRISSTFPAYPGGYFLQGVTRLALGQVEAAEVMLGKYLRRVPGDPEATRLAASAALRQHGAARAIDYLKPLADQTPPDAKTLTLLGNAYMADGKPELALQQFEKAASLDPENMRIKTRVAVAEIGVGQGHEGLEKLEEMFARAAGAVVAGPTLVLAELHGGHVDEAGKIARSLIDRDADNPLYLTLLGDVRAAQRDYASAETAFRTALWRDAGFAPAARELAELYRKAGRTDDAKQVYGDLLAKKATDVTALLGLADIAIAAKNWSEAIDLLNKARGAPTYDPTPGLKLTEVYEVRGDWKSAKAVASELYAKFPRDVNVVVTLGRTRLESGDTNAALSAYKLANQLAPDSAPIRSAYVALLKQAHLFREAWDVLQQAVIGNPQDAQLKADLLRADAAIDGVEGAVARAQTFAASEPDNSIYDLVSAELYEEGGRPGEAVAVLEKAMTAHPSDDAVAIALARLYTRMGDLGKAEKLLSARMRADPKNIAVGSALAPLYLMTGRPDEAKKTYSDIVAQKPDDVAALIGLADIVVAERRWPEAMDYIGRARAAAPNDPGPGLTLVNLYAVRRDWQNAITTAADLADKFPRNVDVIDKLGRVQIAAGDTAGAVNTYRQAYGIAPNSRAILSRYLDALKAAKNSSGARTMLRAALDRDPRNASLKADLVRIEAQIDGLDAGLAKARNFSLSDPDNAIYDIVSAELYEKAGRGDEAVPLLEKAVAARSSDDALTTAISRLYIRMGTPAKAEAVLKARLKVDPKDLAARTELAFYYVGQKREAAAIAEYSRLIEDNPRDPSSLNNLAWLYQRQGELPKARELAQRAFAIAPRDARVDGTLGWIILCQGETDRAVGYLSAANLAAPDDPDIQYHLAVALHRVGRPAEARGILETLLGSGGSFADKTDAAKLLQELKGG